MFRLVAAYMLGAFTFWPPIGLAVYFGLRAFGKRKQRKRLEELKELKELKELRDAKDGKNGKTRKDRFSSRFTKQVIPELDRTSRIEAACYVRVSSRFAGLKRRPGGAKFADKKVETREALEEASKSKDSRDSKDPKEPLEPLEALETLEPLNKLVEATEIPLQVAKKVITRAGGDLLDVQKFERYWAVVRGGQLQLFTQMGDAKPAKVVKIPENLVVIWPQGLKEHQLFRPQYPITFIDRQDSQSVASLEKHNIARDPRNTPAPGDALYIYVDSPMEKEDMYFALIRESQYQCPKDAAQNCNPAVCARPLRAKKSENQILMNSVWNEEIPEYTQWFNALIGRLFLGLKDSDLVMQYIAAKFTEKFDAISESSDLVGDIEILEISTGCAAPIVTDMALRELTPEGHLTVSAGVAYSGKFKVHLATKIKLAAVSTVTVAEIPVELAATLKSFSGTVLIIIKPPPSERIWYSFETMPDIDLDIEPVIYDTPISLSMVTNFLKSKIVNSVRDYMVYPHMEDYAFYSTANQFYRGGIWRTPDKQLSEYCDQVRTLKQREDEELAATELEIEKNLGNTENPGNPGNPENPENPENLRTASSSLKKIQESAHSRSNSAHKSSELGSAFGAHLSGSDVDKAVSTMSNVAASEVSTVRKIGSWVRKYTLSELPLPVFNRDPKSPVSPVSHGNPVSPKSPKSSKTPNSPVDSRVRRDSESETVSLTHYPLRSDSTTQVSTATVEASPGKESFTSATEKIPEEEFSDASSVSKVDTSDTFSVVSDKSANPRSSSFSSAVNSQDLIDFNPKDSKNSKDSKDSKNIKPVSRSIEMPKPGPKLNIGTSHPQPRTATSSASALGELSVSPPRISKSDLGAQISESMSIRSNKSGQSAVSVDSKNPPRNRKYVSLKNVDPDNYVNK